MYAVETCGLTKYYGKSRGIVDLNLTVEEGDFFGFIGPNGAGKSTTIRCLLGLIGKSGGSAQIFGKDISKGSVSILSNVGYMPSEAVFYGNMRVKDIIKFSAKLRHMNCDDEAAKLCERLQLDTSKKIDELSLGNRKKAAIVCAMQHTPDMYIFDEPTSGLDPLMQREFFEILKERHENGATIFISSHVLSEIQRYCSRAAIIREGKLIACDRVEALSQTGAKRVIINGINNLDGIQNVRDLQKTSDGIGFLYSGDINILIRKLSEVNISDITISEPDLEEVFMHYYTEGGSVL